MKFSIRYQGKRYETASDTAPLVKAILEMSEEIVEVDLSGNYFSEEAMIEVCGALRKIPDIRVVYLSDAFAGLSKEKLDRNLTLLCDVLMDHKIQMIDLSNNAISSELPNRFCDFLSKTTELVHLKINNCGLGSVGGNSLGEYLRRIVDKEKLEIIEVAQNRFFSFPKELRRAIMEFPNIREIRVQYNTINEETMLELLEAVKDHSLEVFDMRDNSLSQEGCRLLGDLYCKWDVRELRIGDCVTGSEGVKEFLKKANKKFFPMSLPGNYSKSERGIVLDISYNNVGQDTVEDMLEFCGRNSIEKLITFGNLYEDISEVTKVVAEQNGAVVTEEDLHDSVSEETGGICKSLLEEGFKL